jgi:AAA domain, putative AbiEii toxin, Type IV TA system/AAA ATPase domain
MIAPDIAGYRMIDSLDIRNFRALEKVSLKGLSRINVVVGPNASGKTALLEAITLGCRASPQEALRMWLARTQTQVVPSGDAGFRAIWSGFFPGLDLARALSIQYTDSENNHRGLRIMRTASPPVVVEQGRPVPTPRPTSGATDIVALAFERRLDNTSEPEIVSSHVGPQGQLIVDNADPIGPAVAMFSAFAPPNEADNITWYSELSLANREKEALTILQQEFPSVRSLDILGLFGVQGLYVTYGGSPTKLPVGLVSTGIHKVLSIILASLTYQKGVLLIDEVENGIFYRRYRDLWSLMRRLAVQRNNQIFTTSHSLECLRAALPVVEKHPQEFSLIRMGIGPDGVTARQYSGAQFAAALAEDVDPRGGEPGS